MNQADVIQRLHALADEHDDRADGHYRSARRARLHYREEIERTYGSAERRNAAFLRSLADGIEDARRCASDEWTGPEIIARITEKLPVG